VFENHGNCPGLHCWRSDTIQALLSPEGGGGGFCIAKHDLQALVETIAE
jgi:hypothetical protein